MRIASTIALVLAVLAISAGGCGGGTKTVTTSSSGSTSGLHEIPTPVTAQSITDCLNAAGFSMDPPRSLGIGNYQATEGHASDGQPIEVVPFPNQIQAQQIGKKLAIEQGLVIDLSTDGKTVVLTKPGASSEDLDAADKCTSPN